MTRQRDFMLYHSTLRNVASFSALALGSIGFLRFYRDKNKSKSMYVMSLLLCLCIFIIPLSVSSMYVMDMRSYDLPERWKMLARFILFVIILMMSFGVMILYEKTDMS